jgi:hypothetical protein
MDDQMAIWDTLILVGDFVQVRKTKTEGGLLAGTVLSGTVSELIPARKMVRLERGALCRASDKLLDHRKAHPAAEGEGRA